MRRLFFDLWYWLPVRPPWDSGISPPELTAVVEGASLPAGRALDLGCGTGTNVIYLARHGWQAVGVDFAGGAIRLARRKARAAPAEVAARCEFHRADVTDLSTIKPPFDLALDMGCLHSLERGGRARYAAGLARLLRPGALYLLYAFKPGVEWLPGLTEEDVVGTFQESYHLAQVVQGTGWPSAWYTFQRA